MRITLHHVGARCAPESIPITIGQPLGTDTELVAVGKVMRPHGVGGVVRLLSYSDDPARLEQVDRLYVRHDDSPPRKVRVVGYQDRCVLLKLEGSETREDADALRGIELMARVEDLPPLCDGEYFVHDIVGLDVFLTNGQLIGTLVEVMSLPAGDLYVVDMGHKHTMIPAVAEIVRLVDTDSGRIVVAPPTGLLEL